MRPDSAQPANAQAETLALLAERRLLSISHYLGDTEIACEGDSPTAALLVTIDDAGKISLGGRYRDPLEPFRPTLARIAELRAMPYRDYLRSPEWKARRRWLRHAAQQRCERCHATDRLQVHHRTYDNLGCEGDHDLEVLCDDCHRDEHGL